MGSDAFFWVVKTATVYSQAALRDLPVLCLSSTGIKGVCKFILILCVWVSCKHVYVKSYGTLLQPCGARNRNQVLWKSKLLTAQLSLQSPNYTIFSLFPLSKRNCVYWCTKPWGRLSSADSQSEKGHLLFFLKIGSLCSPLVCLLRDQPPPTECWDQKHVLSCSAKIILTCICVPVSCVATATQQLTSTISTERLTLKLQQSCRNYLECQNHRHKPPCPPTVEIWSFAVYCIAK